MTAWGPRPTSWGTRWGPASSSTFPAKSCSVRMQRCAALWSRIKRRPTSWSARKTTSSITQTVRPPCEAFHWFWPSSRGIVELCVSYNIYECILSFFFLKKERGFSVGFASAGGNINFASGCFTTGNKPLSLSVLHLLPALHCSVSQWQLGTRKVFLKKNIQLHHFHHDHTHRQPFNNPTTNQCSWCLTLRKLKWLIPTPSTS